MAPHLLICFRDDRKKHHHISHRGLGVSSQLIAMYLRKNGFRVETLPCDGHGAIEHKIAGTPGLTNVVVMAPWLDPATVSEWCQKWPEIQFAITCHSNLAFLQADRTAARLIPQYCALSKSFHNFHMAANAATFSQWVSMVYNCDALTLPNLYWVNMQRWRPRPKWDGGTLNIGMFGAIRSLKNFSSGAGAALALQRILNVPVNLYVNTGRIEGGNISVVQHMIEEDPHVQIIDTPWEEWPIFTRRVAGMNLMLQPSLTESFNIVTADGVAHGVCSVVGPAIDWVPQYWKANPDNAMDIARVGRLLIQDQSAPYDGIEALNVHNVQGLKLWETFLTSTHSYHQF